MIVVVMGVAGVGKTTVGKRLAAALGWEFHDADDFHPPENIAKMRAGIVLTDDDRAAWLERLRSLVADVSSHMAPERGGGPAVGGLGGPVPEPKAGEILIQVYATGGTPTEKLWYTTSHYADGSTRSKAIPGHKFSGIVAGLAILADEKCR